MMEMPRERGSSNGRAAATAAVVASHHNPELPGFGDIGSAEDGGGNEVDVHDGHVLGRQLLTERNADGAACDVERARFERVHEAVGAEEDLFVGRIIEEHRNDSVGAKLSFCGSARGDCAFAEQRFRAPLSAVPHPELVAGGEEAQRHGCSHLSGSQKSDLHLFRSLHHLVIRVWCTRKRRAGRTIDWIIDDPYSQGDALCCAAA